MSKILPATGAPRAIPRMDNLENDIGQIKDLLTKVLRNGNFDNIDNS